MFLTPRNHIHHCIYYFRKHHCATCLNWENTTVHHQICLIRCTCQNMFLDIFLGYNYRRTFQHGRIVGRRIGTTIANTIVPKSRKIGTAPKRNVPDIIGKEMGAHDPTRNHLDRSQETIFLKPTLRANREQRHETRWWMDRVPVM